MSDERLGGDPEEEVSLHHDTITERLAEHRGRRDEVVDLTEAEAAMKEAEPRVWAENTLIEIPEAEEKEEPHPGS
jgi:hypothetical protein